MSPHVILHNAVSIDGQTTGFSINNDLFYGVIPRFEEDATLVGSGTILKASQKVPSESEMDSAPPSDNEDAPMLVVCDSQGRIDSWHFWKRQAYWGKSLSLGSAKTPQSHLDYLSKQGVESYRCGDDKVDLGKALEYLAAEHGVKRVRVDSGGELASALLEANLVDEISLILHPTLVGNNPLGQLFRFSSLESGARSLELIHFEKMENDIVWLVYSISGE